MSQLTFEPLLMAERTAAGPRTSAPARIPSSSAVRQQFSRVFRHTAPSFRRQDVFRDFITLAASELDLARIRTPENVENSRRICDRYQPTDIDALKQLFCLLVEGLTGDVHDFLGALYMEQELGADEMGQYFSPPSVSRLMAEMLMPGAQQSITREGWMTLDEPACGSAGMVIALAHCMVVAGMNPSEQLYATCTDIDPMVADMAFIQLALLGIPAKVVTGNTLTLQASRVRYTPVYYFNDWEGRLAFRQRLAAMKTFMASVAA